FSFSSLRVHRDLHSFPTRRSSDLNSKSVRRIFCLAYSSALAKISAVCVARTYGLVKNRSPVTPSAATPLATCLVFSTPSSVRYRSEEHTSELQSRFDLVCRLLLEK